MTRSGPITLRGMTWSHPRGYDPMVAVAAEWQAKTGVTVTWDKRSLQDFESFPVEQLARQYDLIVIDHPHVGQITRENCLAPLDLPERAAALTELAHGSVGLSWPSYFWDGRQWGLPIDAATQVLAWRPDLMDAPPTRWEDVVAEARAGRVLLPLRPPHCLMCLYTLSANAGHPAHVAGPDLFDDHAIEAYERIAELFALHSVDTTGMDPIAVFEAMAAEGSTYALSPLIYGYVNYALDGFRPHRLGFADIASIGDMGPVGSALGGTGIAVSAFSPYRDAAVEFAFHVASGAVQKHLYAASGGQPGHADAWEDDTVNARTHDFYRATRATLEGALLRPRHDGYMAFQESASQRIIEGLTSKQSGARVIADINRQFLASFPG